MSFFNRTWRTKETLTSLAENQYKAYIDFAVKNQYRPLLSADDAASIYDDWKNKCVPSYDGCTDDASTDDTCAQAGNTCSEYVESPLEQLAQFDAYDIRADSDTFPPSSFVSYLTSASVKKAIGATSNFSSCGSTAIGGDDSTYLTLIPSWHSLSSEN